MIRFVEEYLTFQRLFDERPARARNTDPPTSHAAARSMEPTRLQLLVLNCIQSFGDKGVTAEQVADCLHVDKQSITPRFRPLVEGDLIKDSGRKSVNRSGRSAILWVVS